MTPEKKKVFKGLKTKTDFNLSGIKKEKEVSYKKKKANLCTLNFKTTFDLSSFRVKESGSLVRRRRKTVRGHILKDLKTSFIVCLFFFTGLHIVNVFLIPQSRFVL